MDPEDSRVTGAISPSAAGDFNVTVLVANAQGGDAESASFIWAVEASALDFSNIANGSVALSWIEIEHVTVLGAPKTYLWAPVDLVDDLDYYGGFKEARVIGFGDVTRGLSDEAGNYESTEFSFIVSDTDRAIRGLLDSAFAKLWQNRMVVIRMIDDASRRLKVIPYVLTRGIIRNFKPRGPLHFEFTAKDFLTSSLGAGNTEKEIPNRKVTREDFPKASSAAFGLPVPIIYGRMTDKDERIVTVSDIVTNDNVTYEIVGAPGTTTYLYTVAALPPNPPGFGIDPTNAAQDNDHRQEMTWGQVLLTDGPSAEEWVPGSRFVRIKWNNVGEQQREAWWAGGAHVPGGAVGGATSRVYGRAATTPQQLLMGLGTQAANNAWDDDNRSSRAPSSNPPVNNVVYEGDPFAPGTQIKVDRGSGVIPTLYVGARNIGGTDWEEFLVAGHAIKSIDEWYCGGVRQHPSTESVDFLIPGYAGYIAAVGAATYRDFNGRRYTVLYAKGPKAERAIDGTAPITLNMQGIEFAGDGTGLLIDQLADIYKHFVVNFGFQAWETGAWLNAPVWEQGLDPAEEVRAQIDLPSFDTMRVVHQRRIEGGYPGGIMFGSPTSGTANLRDALARLNISCDSKSGFNRHSQFFVSIFDESITVLDDARLYTQKDDIIAAAFEIDNATDQIENSVHYVFSRRYATHFVQTSTAGFAAAEWLGDETQIDQESIDKLRETRQGSRLDLWGVRDEAVALDIAQRRLLYYKEPPTPVKMTTTLKGLSSELGDIIAVDSIEGGGPVGWVGRPLRIVRQITNPQRFTVAFEAVDAWRLYSTAFILGDDVAGSPTELPEFWTDANSAQRLRGYLCDETTKAFSTGEDGKRLR